MEFVCYRTLQELPESAERLFADAAHQSLFFSRVWLENLLEQTPGSGENLLLASVIENHRILALLPLVQPDGGHCFPLKHLYTSLYTLWCRDRDKSRVVQCLVEGLARQGIDSLQLEPVAELDPNIRLLEQAMTSAGYVCQRYFKFYNWFHRPGNASYADYLATRPSRVRNTLARKQRKLDREHGYRIELHTEPPIAKPLAAYHSVYKSSWKASEVYQPFIDGLAEELAQQGWLRLAILYVGETPIAAQFWFLAHGRANIFKLAYDENWKRYSPGSILFAHLMQHVIDNEQVDEIDFLTGNDAYKADWMSARRERWCLSCIRQKRSVQTRINPVSRLWQRIQGS